MANNQALTSGNDTTNAFGMGQMGQDGYRVYMEVVGGGWGAMADADGADVVDSYVGNCSNVPVESLEIDFPFMRIGDPRQRETERIQADPRNGLTTPEQARDEYGA